MSDSISDVGSDRGSIYLADFDRDSFMQVMTMYAAPCAIAILCGSLSLSRSRFHFHLLPTSLLRDWVESGIGVGSASARKSWNRDGKEVKANAAALNAVKGGKKHGAAAASATSEEMERELLASVTGDIADNADETFEHYLAWLYPSSVFLILLAPFSLIAFTIAAMWLLDHMLVVSIAYMLLLTLTLTWTMLRWRAEEWRMTMKIKLLFAFMAATATAFEIFKAFYARPYSFIGLSVFCLMINMCAMMTLAYYLRDFKPINDTGYFDMTTPILRDLHQVAAALDGQHMATPAGAPSALSPSPSPSPSYSHPASPSAAMTPTGVNVTIGNGPNASINPNGMSMGMAIPPSDVSLRVDGGGAARDVSHGSNEMFASHQYFLARRSIPKILVMYFSAVTALVGFGLIIDFAGFGNIGYITCGAIVWLDIVILIWVYTQSTHTPLQACLLLALVRFCLVIFGPTYYLLGHTLLFILCSAYFTQQLIQTCLPTSTLRVGLSEEEDEAEEERKKKTEAGVNAMGQQRQAVAMRDEEISGSDAVKRAVEKRRKRDQRAAQHRTIPTPSPRFQSLSLILLIIAFVFDAIYSFMTDDSQIPVGIDTTLPQCAIAFFGLFVFVVYALTSLTFRIYAKQQYKCHGWVLFLSLCEYGFILGCGWLYYWQTSELLLPCLAIFLPPIVYLLIGLFSQWVKNDFHLILPPQHRSPPMAPFWSACCSCGFPGNDYFMVFGMTAELILIVGFGFCLSLLLDPWWIGAIVAWVILVLLTTITPMVEYFHTFELASHMIACCVTAVASFLAGLIVLFFIALDAEFNRSAFILLLVAFLYPTSIIFLFGLAKWHDDGWVMSDFVVWTNFLCSLLLITLFFSIAAVFTPWCIGGALMLIFIIGLAAIIVMPKLKRFSPAWFNLISTIVAILIFGFIVAATLNDSSGFTGFTVLCALSVLGLSCVVYYAYRGSPYDRVSIHRHKLILYSPHIFPIYEYDTMATGRCNPMSRVNHRVWSVYAIGGVCYVWGVFALFFITPPAVGLCVSSLAIAASMLFSLELMHRAARRSEELAFAVDYFDEASADYLTVLSRCKWIATQNQILDDAPIVNMTTNTNKLIVKPSISDIHASTSSSSSTTSTTTVPPIPSPPHFLGLDRMSVSTLIRQLDFIHQHQDWRDTSHRYKRLASRMSMYHCCAISRRYDEEVEGVNVSRREAFRVLDELFVDSVTFYRRHTLYHLNLQQELIKEVEARRYGRWNDIVAMLREAGQTCVTIDYIRSLPIGSPELERYEVDVERWLEKRAKKAEEAARIKRERDLESRRRALLARDLAAQRKQRRVEEAAAKRRKRREEMEKEKRRRLQEEEERRERLIAQQMAEFERQQRLAEEEAMALERQRAAEEEAKRAAELERERQRRIADKRREQKALAERALALSAASLAARAEAAAARQRRRAERKAREMEHEATLKRKKNEMERKRREEEMEKKMREMEQRHKDEMERMRREQEARDRRHKQKQKEKDESEERGRVAAIAAASAERAREYGDELARLRAEMAEKERRIAAEQEKSAALTAAAARAAEDAAKAEAEAHKQAKAAAEAEEKRREEEQRQKEEKEEEERERERDKQRLDAERRQREAERKRRETERAATRQAERQQRMKEIEAERQAAKRRIEEKNKKEMSDVESASRRADCCTYQLTGDKMHYQAYWQCDTCADANGGADADVDADASACFCFACAQECHAGHTIRRVGEAPCFCDCGASASASASSASHTCLMMLPKVERQNRKERSKVTHTQSVNATIEATRAMDDPTHHPCQDILKQCQSRGESWTDPDFPHDDRSLFGSAPPLHPQWQGCEWARIRDICPDPTVFLPPIDANDIRQGSLGNCWFMSACSVLTQKPEALMGVFVTKEYNEQGVYGLRFFKNGQVANVTVDDWLPVQRRANGKLDALFAKAKDSKSVWVMLIEKAFAKLHMAYQNIEGGWVDDALCDLAGGVSERLNMRDEENKKSLIDGSLWSRLLSYHQQGFLLGCGSPMGVSDAEEHASQWNIVQSHAYSILRVVSVDGLQLIEVRNPWGRVEWTGDWSDGSPLWTRRLKSKVGWVEREDGAFWMSWQDFTQHFEELYICRFYDSTRWLSRGKVFGEWRAQTAGGCVNYETVANNVQYGLTLLESGPVQIAVSLQQSEVRGVEGKAAGEFETITLSVYDNHGQPITYRVRGQQLAFTCMNKCEIFIECEFNVSAAPHTLTILPTCFDPGVETGYALAWYTTRPAKLQQFNQNNANNNDDQVRTIKGMT